MLLGVILIIDARTHTLQRQRRNAYPDVTYDESVLDDAAADDDTQNDGDKGDDDNQAVDAVITNSGEHFRVGVGRSVRLPCIIDPSPKENKQVVFEWYKENESLFIGNLRTGGTDNMSIDEETQNYLVIRDMKATDSGNYRCQILDEREHTSQRPKYIDHVVRVEETPSILNMTVTGRQVIEGTLVRITCVVSGSPPPKIIWSIEDDEGNSHKLTEQDGEFTSDSVIIKSIRHDQQGKYICMADNNVGTPAVQSVKIQVLGKPRVHVHKTVVNSAVNVEAVLRCSAHQEPSAHIRWYKDGDLIESTPEHVVSTVGQESTLTVNPRGDDDFGTFTCEAENMYGKHNRSISLVQTPVVEDLDVDGMNLSWKVHSHDQLKEVKLDLTEIETGESFSFVIPLPRTHSPSHHMSYSLDAGAVRAGRYTATVKATNRHDTGAADTMFTVDSPPQSIQGASVYRGSGNNAVISTLSTHVFITSAFMYLFVRML